MSENRHTPGPWRIGEDGRFGISVWGEEHVADVKTYERDARKANARLIAAAPDLLEALQVLFASYKALADSGDAGNWKIENQPEGKQALAAISKATGADL